jgi:acetyl esterase/lipase
MTSFSYRLMTFFVSIFGHKHVFALDEDDFVVYLTKHAPLRANGIPLAMRAKYKVSTRFIGASPCHVLEPRKGWRKDAPVVMFLHGGGFVFEAMPVHWMAVDRIIAETGAQLWFVAYPLLPEATVYEASWVTIEAYLCMLEAHRFGLAITVIGDSAGATLALILAHWLRTHAPDLPQPKNLVVVSPAEAIVSDASLREQMDALSDNDVMLTTSLLDVLDSIMLKNPELDEFFATPLEGEFSGFPRMDIFSGTKEIFWPLMEPFTERVAAAGVPVTLHRGEGMCHVWPYLPFVPESKQALKTIVQLVR